MSIHNISDEFELSVIIPLMGGLLDSKFCNFFDLHKVLRSTSKIEVIIVNNIREDNLRPKLEAYCKQHNYRLLECDFTTDDISLGGCRDFGVLNSRGKLVTFFELDLIVDKFFFDNLLLFSHAYGCFEFINRFFFVATRYLGQNIDTGEISKDNELLNLSTGINWAFGNSSNISVAIPYSSVIVINRWQYLSIGGYNTNVLYKGYENEYLIHRLYAFDQRLPQPNLNYYSYRNKETCNSSNAPYFSFLSEVALFSGLSVFIDNSKDDNKNRLNVGEEHEKNISQLFETIDRDPRAKRKICPLVDPSRDENCFLYIAMLGTPSAECLRGAMPYLGSPIFAIEDEFRGDNGEFDKNLLRSFLSNNDIDLIVFPNPYKNELRRAMYDWAREVNFPYMVFERGALPDSWFFDPEGFNIDSSSYNYSNWSNPLIDEQKKEIQQYIDVTMQGNLNLENQGQRRGGKALKEELVPPGNKLLFVPFQRPLDTVTRGHFVGNAESVEDFARTIDEATKNLKSLGWTVVCKRHPREFDDYKLEYAQYADPNIHFLDLIDACDAVALINSGVGVYAMMTEKPCYIFGNAFYAHPELNTTIGPGDDFINLLNRPKVVNKELMLQFLYYLRTDFYSYGTSINKKTIKERGQYDNKLVGISFYELKIPGSIKITTSKETDGRITKSAPILNYSAFKKSKKLKRSKKPVFSKRSLLRKFYERVAGITLLKNLLFKSKTMIRLLTLLKKKIYT